MTLSAEAIGPPGFGTGQVLLVNKEPNLEKLLDHVADAGDAGGTILNTCATE